MEKNNIKIDKLAFEGEKRGYYFRAYYLEYPEGQALIEISKEGKLVKSFLFPSYKIWNISAHSDDIIDGLNQGNDDGLYMAASCF